MPPTNQPESRPPGSPPRHPPSPERNTAGILPSKLAAPAAAPTHLPRQRLLAAIEKLEQARLVLVRAPAGFGKTTLLQQYRDRCQQARRQTLWLTLDTSDNDLHRFALHLEHGRRMLDAPAGAVPAQLDDLLERVSAIARPFSILLDEFEVVTQPSVLNFVQQLLDALPRGSALVIASRTTPDIGLGRIRARGQMVEIGPGALRFSPEEVATYVRDKCRLPLGDGEIATLHRCTEGWIAAVYLATLSLQGRSDHAGFVASFSGTNLELAEYLSEDVLSRQSEACQSFLLQTSVLDRLTVPLCNALTGNSDADELLTYLRRANLLLFPVDDAQRWFRYHSLFASFLRDALERRMPGRAVVLHRAAARWFEAEGRPVPAIEYLLRARATGEAADLLAAHVDMLMDTGRSGLLLRWLDQIPTTEIDRLPALAEAYAWTLALHRRHADAMALIARATRGEAPAPASLKVQFIHCFLLALTDRVEECLRAGMALLPRLPPDDVFRYRVIANSVAYSMVSTGRYDEARSLLSRAMLRGGRGRSPVMSTVAASIEGILDLIQGRLGNALARLQAASSMPGNPTGGEMLAGRTSLEITLSIPLYETNAVDEAEQLVMQNLPYVKHSSPPDSLIVSHVLAARLARMRDDHTGWRRLLAELEQIGQECGSARVVCSAWLERARVATLERRLDEAELALRQADRHGACERPDVLHYGSDVDTPLVTRIRLLVALGLHDVAAQQARDAIEAAASRSHRRRELKLRLLLALALAGHGNEVEALAELDTALRFASHEGFLRSFLDEGPPLAMLLQRWSMQRQGHGDRDGIEAGFLANVLEQCEAARQSPASCDGPDSLTAREREVLALLAAGHRNKVIAERMFLSEFTVKSHLRKINAKLGAQGRTEAVAIARARGLLK